MILVNVHETNSDIILYRLLKERPASVNISHREVPTWKQHTKFISSKPYAAWYLIMEDEKSIKVYGSVYLTKNDEIGIFILKEHQGKGYAPRAIKKLMELYPRNTYLANINPSNRSSKDMFKKMGFTHLQETYVFNA